jgi:hypothetical protein
MELYINYVNEQQWKASQILMQSNPHTAHGFGLDELLKVLELRPRSSYETDEVIRERIVQALT